MTVQGAVLVHAMEQTVQSDFALLHVYQERCGGEADCSVYVTSARGELGMTCGTKYARPRVRVEWWNQQPASVSDEWEDVDEVPFEEIPDGGALVITGFDPPTSEAPRLDISGFGHGRAQVLARGRHLYEYGDDAQGHSEQWLVRLWSSDLAPDALAGPPRRIGRAGATLSESGWSAAFAEWERRGWGALLSQNDAYRSILTGLRDTPAGRPLTPDEMLARWQVADTHVEPAQRRSWDSPVLGRQVIPAYLDSVRRKELPALELMARFAGMDVIATFADMLTAMTSVGLLASTTGQRPDRLVPNPAPPPVWELEPDWPDTPAARLAVEFGRFRYLNDDLLHLIRWAPDQGLTTTPIDIAVRLSTHVSTVIGAITFLPSSGHFGWQSPTGTIERDTPVTIYQLTRRGEA